MKRQTAEYSNPKETKTPPNADGEMKFEIFYNYQKRRRVWLDSLCLIVAT